MRRVSHIMGTAVVIDIPGLQHEADMEATFDDLRAVDEQFSPYKVSSELSRFRRGELSAEQISIGMKEIMKACLEAERYTDGYFSARYLGEFDPTGYVKGWAIAELRSSLIEQGFETFCISVGGDISAKSTGPKTWRIGLQNPKKPKSILAVIKGKNIAVATSGSYERGPHIINPKTGKPAKDFLSLAVAGPEIIKADVFATAAFAMGQPGLEFVDKQLDYGVLAVDRRGKVFLSSAMVGMIEGDLAITGEVV